MSEWTHERIEIHKTVVKRVALNFSRYNESFKRIRKRDKGCKLCRKSFEDNQLLHLGFTDKGNKLICQKCANEAILHGVECFDDIEKQWINGQKENPQ